MVGIIGSIDEKHSLSIRGNGKTATMTYLLYEKYYVEGLKTYTNYKTLFSEYVSTEELGDVIFNNNDDNIKGIGIDEIQIFYDSYSRVSKKSKYFINVSLIQQSRKKNVDIFYTIQRLRDLEKRIRTQTDLYLVPVKYHADDSSVCCLDRCKRDHYFVVYELSGRPLFSFKVEDVGRLYDQFSIVA